MIGVIVSVIEIDDIRHRDAALSKGQMIIFDLILLREEVGLISEMGCSPFTTSSSQGVELRSR